MQFRSVTSRLGHLAIACGVVGLVAAGAFVNGGPAIAAGPAAFSVPVEIPNSAGRGEPSLALDSTGRWFATAPQSLGNVSGGGSMVWTSTKNDGSAWNNGVRPTGDPVSGGDTDLAIDSADNVYQTDLWLGNTAMAVSTDHGASFVANEYGHTIPGDDRPWLAYSMKDNAIYMVWDGETSLDVQKSAALSQPQLGILPGQEVPVIPETAATTSTIDGLPVRACVCPPGGIAVDQNSGQVYVTYSRQNGSGIGGGVGVARSDNSGVSWTTMSIPGTGSTGSAFDVEYNFAPVKVDNNGTVYVAWGEGRNIAGPSGAANGGVAIKYAYSKDHGATWSIPVTVSTISNTATFPAMDVVSPGVIDVAWYGTTATGDPNEVAASTSWDLDFAQVTGADTASPSFTPSAAVTGTHTGCIQTGNLATCTDRSLLDFFQVTVDHSGMAGIIYANGNANPDGTSNTHLYFVHQIVVVPTPTPTPSPTPSKHGKKPPHGAATSDTARPQYRSIRSF